jgi:hypothetical protein
VNVVKELLIRIGILSDATPAQAAEQALKAVAGEADRAAAAGKSMTGDLRSGVDALLPGLGRMATAAGALAAVIGTAKKALREFSQQELSETDLESALASSTKLTGEYLARLKSLSSEMQDMVNIGDEQWLKAYAQLTRFGMSSKNVDQVTEALKNLTGLLDGDFSSAVMLIQRALQGHTEMFGRYGISVEKTGDKVKDLDNLFRSINEKGAGLLEARAQTLSGTFSAVRKEWGELMETIGRAEASPVAAVNRWLANMLHKIRGTIEVEATAVTNLTNRFPSLAEAAKSAQDTLDAMAKSDFAPAISSAEDLAARLKAAGDEAATTRQRLSEVADAELAYQEAQIERQVQEGEMGKEEGERRKLALKTAKERADITRQIQDVGAEELKGRSGMRALEYDLEKKAAEAELARGAYRKHMERISESGLFSAKDVDALRSGKGGETTEAIRGMKQVLDEYINAEFQRFQSATRIKGAAAWLGPGFGRATAGAVARADEIQAEAAINIARAQKVYFNLNPEKLSQLTAAMAEADAALEQAGRQMQTAKKAEDEAAKVRLHRLQVLSLQEDAIEENTAAEKARINTAEKAAAQKRVAERAEERKKQLEREREPLAREARELEQVRAGWEEQAAAADREQREADAAQEALRAGRRAGAAPAELKALEAELRRQQAEADDAARALVDAMRSVAHHQATITSRMRKLEQEIATLNAQIKAAATR